MTDRFFFLSQLISLPIGQQNQIYPFDYVTGSNQSHFEKVSCSIEVSGSHELQSVSSNLGEDIATKVTSLSNTSSPSSNIFKNAYFEYDQLTDESSSKDGAIK